MIQYFFIRKTNCAKPSTNEMHLSLLIVVLLYIVYVAINLNDQCTFVAVEVNDKAVNDLLSAEMKTTKVPGAKFVPEGPFGSRQFPP